MNDQFQAQNGRHYELYTAMVNVQQTVHWAYSMWFRKLEATERDLENLRTQNMGFQAELEEVRQDYETLLQQRADWAAENTKLRHAYDMVKGQLHAANVDIQMLMEEQCQSDKKMNEDESEDKVENTKRRRSGRARPNTRSLIQ